MQNIPSEPEFGLTRLQLIPHYPFIPSPVSLTMAPKSKGGSKKKAAPAKPQPSTPEPPKEPPKEPRTVREQAWHLYYLTNPTQKAYEEHGINGMSLEYQQAHINLPYLQNPALAKSLSNKAQKELWKQLNECSIPLPYRSLPRPRDDQWGKDKNGRDIGDYTIEEYEALRDKKDRLYTLKFECRLFRREATREGQAQLAGSPIPIEHAEEKEAEVNAERERRREMAALKKDLYGETTGPYAMDPDWDDVVPIPQSEPEGALASIAYPEDYAEAMSYLRAVMATQEHSERCLRLTEHIISMNPAHYTVWLYRFAIIQHLKISIPDEIKWLDDVSLRFLKNYQIWHHRQLLLDHYYPTIAGAPEDVAALARNERAFLIQMLECDTKNYHVWSYRQYLVRKLGMWEGADPEELANVEDLIRDDVRNNSAWSHRFFLVFSDPSRTTPDAHATEADPKVPAQIVDRELAYAQAKIELAPQNQSPWNYLRGVLVKGGRELGSVRAFCEGFASQLGEGEEKEEVRSSHALDLLADIYKEAGEKDKAVLCLDRLGDKWDRVRKGYWEYRKKML
ncbi:protein prenylyltransferase [Xylariomycetidae sp. FL2044]|nr:protein prenylyltransferase [Xylariomycetidae sp. FL2044]